MSRTATSRAGRTLGPASALAVLPLCAFFLPACGSGGGAGGGAGISSGDDSKLDPSSEDMNRRIPAGPQHPPEALAAADVVAGAVPLVVSFDATGSADADGDIARVVWKFGDGSPSREGMAVSHAYSDAGEYTATLTVMDRSGMVSQDAVTVRVSEELCPHFSGARMSGTVESGSIVEASGLVASRKNPQVLWAHNDSGDSARLFALSTRGSHLGTYTLAGAGATDWEDIALGPGPAAGVSYLYVGDIGDNERRRSHVDIYRVPEPIVVLDQEPRTREISGAERLELHYPDGPHDADTLLVDPRSGDLYLVTISESGESGLYLAPFPQPAGGAVELVLAGTLAFGSGALAGGKRVTAGDISPLGNWIGLRTYSSAFLWLRRRGESVAEVLASEPCSLLVAEEPQGDAFAFAADASGYFTLSEGSYQPLYFFAREPQKEAEPPPPNESPQAVCRADTSAGTAPLVVTFDAAGSTDPDGNVASLRWDFGDGSEGASGERASHTYLQAGTFVAALTATDDRGASASCDVVILVEEAPGPPPDHPGGDPDPEDREPEYGSPPRAVADAAPTSGVAPLEVVFDASSSTDADGDVMEILWAFGDGTTASGATAVHTYATAGTYTAIVTVTDSRGEASAAEVTVRVASPEECPTFARGDIDGTVQSSSIREASGIVASRRYPGVLWVHNDSGDSARLFAMSTRGRHLGAYAISGASARDWEDLALGPGPQPGEDYLYIGDIGDNARSRSHVTVYRVLEPAVDPDQDAETFAVAGAERLEMRYPDGRARDAEALFADPLRGDLYIVTKSGDGRSGVYRCAAPHVPGQEVALEPVAELHFGTGALPGSRAVTAGDISPDGRWIVLKTYSHGFLWRRAPGGAVAEAFAGEPCPLELRSEPQGEAIGFAAGGESYYTLSEGVRQPLYYYALAVAP